MTSPDAPAAATTALQAARELAGVEWDFLEGETLLAATAAPGRVKALIDGALVNAAARLEQTGAVDATGWATTKDFLTYVLGGPATRQHHPTPPEAARTAGVRGRTVPSAPAARRCPGWPRQHRGTPRRRAASRTAPATGLRTGRGG